MLCGPDSRVPLFLAGHHRARRAGKARRAAPALPDDCRSARPAPLGQSVAWTSRDRKTAVAEGDTALAATKDGRGGRGPGTRNDQPSLASPWTGALVTD